MRRVRVRLSSREDHSYDVITARGLLRSIPEYLPEAEAYAVISDHRAASLYGVQLVDLIKKAGKKCGIYTFKPGEKSKTRETKSKLEDALFAGLLGRDGCIIACGGGVTGDVAGFVAATYMRGVPYVQVPTTLLAMVDSSVGGKVAVDVKAGKNMVGAFYQPRVVFIDPEALRTLPKRQIRAGLGEVVKHAVLADEKFFYTLIKKAERLLDGDAEAFEPVLAANCAIKASVVSADERESNYRQVLNYGHTAAHAIEKVSNYRILHGEAVAVGMAVEATISNLMGIFPDKHLDLQNELLERLGFSLSLPKGVMPENIIEAMQSDKKVRASKVRMALPERIGKMFQSKTGLWAIAPPDKVIRAALKKFVGKN